MPGVIVRTFLVDGEPEGLRTLEVSNSTVHATVFPRPGLDRFLPREQADRPGVYVLVGTDPESNRTRIYIGQADRAGDRLRRHGLTKDFWTTAIIFTSKDEYLTKTQVQVLEARLVAEARAAARVVLDNTNAPPQTRIAEADLAEVEGFLAQVRLLLGAAGFDFLRSRATSPGRPMAGDVFVYRVRKAEARLVRTSTSYTVLKGSTALVELRRSAQAWVERLRRELSDAGILVPGGADSCASRAMRTSRAQAARPLRSRRGT